MNPWLLELACLEHGFTSNKWGTVKQWNDKGGKIIKGSKGTWIVWARPVVIQRDKDDPDAGTFTWYALRWFCLFNLEQVEGDDPRLEKLRPQVDPKEIDPLTAEYDIAQNIVVACKDDGLTLRHTGNRAFWTNDTENVTVPKRDQFESDSAYFETVFHEIGHWTELKRHTDWDRAKHGYAHRLLPGFDCKRLCAFEFLCAARPPREQAPARIVRSGASAGGGLRRRVAS